MTAFYTPSFTIATEFDHCTRCFNCGAGYSDDIMNKLSKLFNAGRTITCRKCNELYSSLSQFEIWVRPDASPFFSEKKVRSSSWFHTTDDPHWFANIQNGGNPEDDNYGSGDVMVHLGMKHSAIARAQQRQDEYLSYGITVDRWYLCEVVLTANTNIHAEIQEDDNTFPTHSNQKAPDYLDWFPDGVTRYLNAYELPGSISLLANANSIKLLSVQDL